MSDYNVLSLFSSAGIGELGLKASGMNIILSNELLKDRCELYRENYPETENICGDIWNAKDLIIERWNARNIGSPFLIYATPPCQGMSFNSIGKLRKEIREGRRPKEDPRNRLIIPTMNIIKSLRSEWIILENVPGMQHTIIRDDSDTYVSIIDYIKEQLGDEYIGKAEVVNCANYGIPQKRERLITIFSRNANAKVFFEKHQSFIPPTTHSEHGDCGMEKWVSLKEAIGSLPPLSGRECDNIDKSIPWHLVPIMKEEKYWWVANTPYNETAYNNQCPSCGCQDNERHGMCMINGIHQSKKHTPIYCKNCGALLPRPSINDKSTGERRIIKGFDSAYRRMTWDTPAGTITQNFQYEASDKKIHPEQNRVLSVYEGMILQTISNYKYSFEVQGVPIKRNMCCQIIGESVPPRLMELICQHIISIHETPTER